MVSLRNFNLSFFRETKDGKIVLVCLDKGMYLLNDIDIILKNHEYFKVENNSTRRLNDSKAKTALKILNEKIDDLIKLSLIFYKAYTLIAPGYYNKTSFKCLESETEIGLKFIKKINDRIDQEKNG